MSFHLKIGTFDFQAGEMACLSRMVSRLEVLKGLAGERDVDVYFDKGEFAVYVRGRRPLRISEQESFNLAIERGDDVEAVLDSAINQMRIFNATNK